jgi:hypothetical protein
MTVKFQDPISAKACIIVSPPFHLRSPTFASHSHSQSPENAGKVLRRPPSRSLPLYRSTAVQTYERRRRRHARRRRRLRTEASRRFCPVADDRRRSLRVRTFLYPVLWFWRLNPGRRKPQLANVYIRIIITTVFGMATEWKCLLYAWRRLVE